MASGLLKITASLSRVIGAFDFSGIRNMARAAALYWPRGKQGASYRYTCWEQQRRVLFIILTTDNIDVRTQQPSDYTRQRNVAMYRFSTCQEALTTECIAANLITRPVACCRQVAFMSWCV